MSDAAPRWLRIGAGLGSAGMLTVAVLLVPGLVAYVVFDEPGTKLNARQGYAFTPYVLSWILFPVNAALFSWIWNVLLATSVNVRRLWVGYLVSVGGGLGLLGIMVAFMSILARETRRVPGAALLWIISVHFLGAVGCGFLVIALRRWRAVTA